MSDTGDVKTEGKTDARGLPTLANTRGWRGGLARGAQELPAEPDHLGVDVHPVHPGRGMGVEVEPDQGPAPHAEVKHASGLGQEGREEPVADDRLRARGRG